MNTERLDLLHSINGYGQQYKRVIHDFTHHAAAPAGFKNVDAQPVGSGASLRETIRNINIT